MTMSKAQVSRLSELMARVEALAGTEGLKLMAAMDDALRDAQHQMSPAGTLKLISFGEQLAQVLGEVRDGTLSR